MTIIDTMNKGQKLNMNNWKNIEGVIDWFKIIKEKRLHKFVIFYIKDFYPSVKRF